jgi:hypothetical protein
MSEAINNEGEVFASWARDAYKFPRIRLELSIKPREKFVNLFVQRGERQGINGRRQFGFRILGRFQQRRRYRDLGQPISNDADLVTIPVMEGKRDRVDCLFQLFEGVLTLINFLARIGHAKEVFA